MIFEYEVLDNNTTEVCDCAEPRQAIIKATSIKGEVVLICREACLELLKEKEILSIINIMTNKLGKEFE